MAKDPLDRETSVSLVLSDSGVKAKAQSRFIAAVDRFGGNLLELINAPIERKTGRERAISAGEIKFIEATAKFGVEQLKYDSEFAQRAAQNYFGRAAREQENKDAVLVEALDDLRRDPPTDSQAERGLPELDNIVLDRLQRYAEGASTADVRQRWGRVISTEVKKPGTFSLRVLRIVDEIDPSIAALFERICKVRLDDAIPKCLVDLEFVEAIRLVEAGLLVEQTGLTRGFVTFTGPDKKEFWGLRFGGLSITFEKDVVLPRELNMRVLTGTAPSLDAYALTTAGSAIATILPDEQKNTLIILGEKFKQWMPSANIALSEVRSDTGSYIQFLVI